MRLLVCGGREFSDYEALAMALDSIVPRPTMIIHGGSNGADLLAGRWAYYRKIRCDVYPANWLKHGKAAGPIRNAQMLDEGNPALVAAFPGGAGTANMVALARRRGVPVQEF